MKRAFWIVPLFLTILMPLAASTQDIDPAKPITVKTGRLTLIEVKRGTEKLAWLVTPPDSSVAELFREEDPASKDVKLRFIAYRDGEYYLVLARGNGDIKQLAYKIVASQQPGPTPPPPTAAAHLTFIGAATPAAAAVVNDAGLRAWLKSAGVKVHVLAAGDPLIESSGLSGAVAKAGGVPCIVVQAADGSVFTQGRITTVQAAKALVTGE